MKFPICPKNHRKSQPCISSTEPHWEKIGGQETYILLHIQKGLCRGFVVCVYVHLKVTATFTEPYWGTENVQRSGSGFESESFEESIKEAGSLEFLSPNINLKVVFIYSNSSSPQI